MKFRHRILLLSCLLLAAGLFVACAGDTTPPPAEQGEDTAAEGDEAYADKMAEEHAGDSPDASPAVGAEPRQPVTTEEVAYATIDGAEVTGFLAKPETGAEGAPAILVIHEWWGLNDNVKAMTRQLAGEGYVALAVDLYRGTVAETPEDARSTMQATMESPEAVNANLEQAHDYLEGLGAPATGSIGWCFGGGMSLKTALLHPDELDAAVIYYGHLETDEATLEPLTMPILGIFGAEDEGIPVESVRAFESALEKLGKDATIHVYEGADHAFANPSGTRYNAEAASDAWQKTLDFFAEHLESEAPDEASEEASSDAA